jgi:integrase
MSKPIIINSFFGPLASTIEKFIAEKRGIGLQYNGVSTYLQNFDRFSLTFRLDDQVLTREVVEAWLKQNPTQSQQTLRMKAIIIRQLGLYMKRMDMNAYIIPEIPKRDHLFLPYIFSDKEIEGILTQADTIKTLSRKTSKHLVVPVFIRLLYFCGLRFSEAQQLRVKNVDLDNGILSIYGSKFDKDRLVPMSPEITNICRAYSEVVHVYSSKNAIYLPNVHNDVYEKRSFYNVYRDLLWMAGISQGGRGNGPRLHDLRHTFAVHCLRKWVQEDADITALLPYLSSYLGHKGLNETAYYLSLTADMFPQVTALLQHELGDIIPEIGGDI